MNRFRAALRHLAEARRPTAAQSQRVLTRLSRTMARPEALSRAPVPRPGGEERVLARLRRPEPARPWGAVLWLAPALLLLLVRLGAAPPLDRDLQGSGPVALTGDVTLDVDGSGRVEGTAGSPRIRWDEGVVRVSVRPDRGIALSVSTREGLVEVVGTGFDVRRDALGTTVAVDHGRVRVTCVDAHPREITAGETLVCPPISAAGRLARVRAIQQGGASPDELVAEIDAGLALHGPAAVLQELRALRFDVLVLAGRRAEAREAAAAYLREGGPRAASIEAVSATLEGAP
jgi:ferric-dicitrate binding protein FerR (iron transport regulator)